MSNQDQPTQMRWATMIPLIGGSAIGCVKSTGVLPQFHLSYTNFAKHQAPLGRYWPEVPMLYLDKISRKEVSMLIKQEMDFVTSVCPCAGLSMMNICKKGRAARGSDAVQNDWMLKSAKFVLSDIKPKVLWGENAPGLFFKIGRDLARKLQLIGQKFGYSFSMVKTNSELHGLPQCRVRTFYFFWRSRTVPMLPWMKTKAPGLLEYLSLIPSWATLQEVYVHEGLASERFRPYQFLLEREGLSHPEFSKKMKRGMTVAQYLEKNGLVNACIRWLKRNYPKETFYKGPRSLTHIHFLRHMKKKRTEGKGYMDVSVKFMGDSFNAVISRNIQHAVHPIEDRFFSIRELLHLMGMPHDFEIDHIKDLKHLCQNVPVKTARDIADEVVKYCQSESEMTKFSFMKQDNVTRKIVESEALIEDAEIVREEVEILALEEDHMWKAERVSIKWAAIDFVNENGNQGGSKGGNCLGERQWKSLEKTVGSKFDMLSEGEESLEASGRLEPVKAGKSKKRKLSKSSVQRVVHMVHREEHKVDSAEDFDQAESSAPSPHLREMILSLWREEEMLRQMKRELGTILTRRKSLRRKKETVRRRWMMLKGNWKTYGWR